MRSFTRTGWGLAYGAFLFVAAAAPGWAAPPVTSGLVFHVSADTITGKNDGDLISSWTDQSGAGNHANQGTAANQPTYRTNVFNGLPAVRLDGNDWIYTATSFANPYTVFTVSKMSGTQNARLISSYNVNWLLGYHGGLMNVLYANGWVAYPGPGADTEPHLYSARGSGTWTAFAHNGSQIASNASGTANIGQINFGSYSAGSEASKGDIAEALVYSRLLTGIEENAVGYYLARKYGLSTTYGSPTPEISNALGATNVTASSASLNGYLAATNSKPAYVAVYWGTADGGTNRAAWANTNEFAGAQGVGPLAMNVPLGAADTLYYYRFVASNVFGETWAPSSASLVSGLITLEVTDPTAAEKFDTGAFTVTRPEAATNGPLTVGYVVGGSASNGLDCVWLDGLAVIPAGATSAVVTVTPLVDMVPEGEEALTVVLVAGGILGTPGSGTVAIADNTCAFTQQVVNASKADGQWSDATKWTLARPPADGDLVVITNNISLTNSTEVLSSLSVGSNKTLRFAGWTTRLVVSNLDVHGTVDHVCSTTNAGATNRVLILARDVTVYGAIDASTNGYQGGVSGLPHGQGPGGGQGGAIDPSGSGGYGGEGTCKSSGGASGNYGSTYGTARHPTGPGSAGGLDVYGVSGGRGGGSVWLEAPGVVQVRGAIRANGQTNPAGGHQGGGSGGAIYLWAGTLSGQGLLSAVGGQGRWTAGGGGGGRIHVRMGLGTEVAATVAGGGTFDRASSAWPAGYPGTYVLDMDGLDLFVRGDPMNHGMPAPQGHGYNSIAPGAWVTNTVASPVEQTNGVRYACIGWRLTTNGVLAAEGNTPQAEFQLLSTNAVLTYYWTNEYELVATAATGGTVTTALNGWYTNGTVVSGLDTFPDANFEFLQWSDDIVTGLHSNTPLTITMDRRRWITAHFGGTAGATAKTFAGGNWFAWTNWSPRGIPGRQDAARLTGGTTLLSLSTFASSLVVNAAATLSFSGWDTLLEATDLTVSGTVTHAACTTNGAATNRVYVLTRTLRVPGSINADGLGYKGAADSGTPFGDPPHGKGPGGGWGGSSPAGGGGHGGEGGNRTSPPGGANGIYGQTNGSALTPLGPGSGGGRGDSRGTGGAGGGSVWVEATDSAVVDGTIRANGTGGVNGHTGGGSGGAIYLRAGTLAGAGQLQASGGAGNWNSGGGGGGRIAVRFVSGSELAHSQTGGVHGPVSTYFSDGFNGSYYVELMGQPLTVAASPAPHGTPTPYVYGQSSLPTGEWVTESVNSPADQANGVRYACIGWTLTTNDAWADAGSTTQAVFQMVAGVTNTTLTFLWTNEFELAATAATNGSVNGGTVNGWYTGGVVAGGIAATPTGGYQFLLWSGDIEAGPHTANPLALTMDRRRWITAHFVDPVNGVTRTRSAGGDWFGGWASWSPAGVPGPQDDVLLLGGTQTLGYAATLRSLAVTNATLAFTNWATRLTTGGDVIVSTNATITHVGCYRYPQDMSNRVWIAANNVLVDGAIDVSAKGYFRGRLPDWGPSPHGQGPGGGMSAVGLNGCGGGYGGAGGRANNYTPGGATYGNATNPIGPGSGGAYGQAHGPEGGGNGGGSVRVEAAGRFILNGLVNADGQINQGGAWGGGGSGGAIWIDCREFAGAAGTRLTARGGDGNWGGGGGGGGRIAIWYTRLFTYAGTNSVAGGVRTGSGWAGNEDGTNGTYVAVFNPPPKGSIFLVR